MKKIIAGVFACLLSWPIIPAAAEDVKYEDGDKFRGAIIACQDRAAAEGIFEAYVNFGTQGDGGNVTRGVEARAFGLGICRPYRRAEGTVAAVIRVGTDRDGDEIVMFHPRHPVSGHLMGDVYAISWDLFHEPIGQEVDSH